MPTITIDSPTKARNDTVAPIRNRTTFAILTAALHLLLKDRPMSRNCNTTSRYDDVRAVSKVLAQVNNSSTDIAKLLGAINKVRKSLGMAIWDQRVLGNDFEALSFLMERSA